jgi:hypothetical protein
MSIPTLESMTQRPALLTPQQMCGIFNLDIRSIHKLRIRRVVLAHGEYRYDPRDVEDFIESRKEVTQ